MKVFNWIMTVAALLLIDTIILFQIVDPWALISLGMSAGWLISRAWGKENA